MVGNIKDLKSINMERPDVRHTAMKVLVSPQEGWSSHVMRLVEVGEGGYTPKHSHPWPHINYMMEGEGELMIDGITHHVTPGSYAYVPGQALHQFKNIGKGMFRFICIVPEEGHQ